MTIKFEQSAAPSALPTPPHSPPSAHPPFFLAAGHQLVPHPAHIHQLHHAQPHPHHKHTATLLDSLTSFYQQEQYWVHHTRAALELAITKGIDAPDASPASSCPVSPAASDASSCEGVRIKAEPDDTGLASPAASTSSLLASPPPPQHASALAPSAHQQAASRWLRRKNQMRLHLSGISTTKRRRPARAPPTEPAARLLEMFAELVDARMESCQRMEKLVRESGRGCAVC